eukprot:gene1298-748_t
MVRTIPLLCYGFCLACFSLICIYRLQCASTATLRMNEEMKRTVARNRLTKWKRQWLLLFLLELESKREGTTAYGMGMRVARSYDAFRCLHSSTRLPKFSFCVSVRGGFASEAPPCTTKTATRHGRGSGVSDPKREGAAEGSDKGLSNNNNKWRLGLSRRAVEEEKKKTIDIPFIHSNKRARVQDGDNASRPPSGKAFYQLSSTNVAPRQAESTERSKRKSGATSAGVENSSLNRRKQTARRIHSSVVAEVPSQQRRRRHATPGAAVDHRVPPRNG